MYTFPQILSGAGYSDFSKEHESRNWQLWTAWYKGPTRDFEERFVFFEGNAGWTDAAEAGEWLRFRQESDFTILIRNSARRLRENYSRVKSTVGSKRCFSVANFLYNTFERALGRIDGPPPKARDFGLEYFVEPGIRAPSLPACPESNSSKNQSSGVSDLICWLRGETDTASNLAVLLAPAGSGKSTLALEIYRRILAMQRADIVPLLVEREQWFSMSHLDAVSLMDVWKAALNAQSTSAIIGPEQLEVCLAEGTVCPIFDGLDELFTLFPNQFNPTETINDLLALFGEGRLLITSRNRYWRESIAPGVRKQVMEIDLLPFTLPQRGEYIRKRFPAEPDKQAKAHLILERLSGKVIRSSNGGVSGQDADARPALERLDALPYVVMLAAESADTDESDVIQKYGHLLSSADPLEGLVLAFCDRERKRHRLAISAEEQLQILEILATEFQGHFDVSEIEIAVQSVSAEADEHQVKRFLDHAMFDTRGERLVLRFSFVHDYLVARVLRQWFFGGADQSGVVTSLRMCSKQTGNLVATCSDLISATLRADWVTRSAERFKDVRHDAVASAGLMHLLLQLARDHSGGSRQEPVETLLTILGDSSARSFTNLRLSGIVQGLDLRNILFSECLLVDVEFVNCIFGGDTIFSRCRLEGKFSYDYCDGLGDAEFRDCILSPSARSSLQRAQQGRRRIPITEEQIKEALTEVLRRFRRGPAGFLTRRQDGVRRGTSRVVAFSDTLLDALSSAGVFRTFLSHGNQMYGVEDTHAVRVYLDNGLSVGTVKAALEHLRRKLGVTVERDAESVNTGTALAEDRALKSPIG
jgi:hypothetical protein